MRIGIAGPISAESIAPFVDGSASDLPRGYQGAPLLGTLIGALLARGHSINAYTTSTDLPLTASHVATGNRFRITFCPQRPRAFGFSGGHWGRAADAFGLERAALRQAMLDDRPDLIHAHWSYEFALAAIDSGLPNLVTCHDAPQVVLRFTPDLYRLSRYFMARRVFKQARCLTAVSPYLEKEIAQYARVPIAVIPNPLPCHSAQHAVRTRQYDGARPQVAMVLNGWGVLKNPQPALRAFAALRLALPGAELNVMGSDYGQGGPAESWAKSQGIAGGVHFLGPQPYAVLLAKLADTDLLLHPSLEETFGMSIAEAMSLGVPVVGGQASGAVPWVIGASGRLVDVRSEHAIAQAAIALLSDAALLGELGIRARNEAQSRFAPDTVAADYERCYLQVLSGVGK